MTRTIRSQAMRARFALFLFGAVMFAGVSAAFGADELVVVYVEGVVERVPVGSEPLAIGDRIPRDSVLLLEADSFIEISAPGGRVMLSQPGRYELASLVAGAGNPALRAASSAVRTLVRNLGRDSARVRQVAAAGVRGDQTAGSAATPVWTDDAMAEELIDEARAYLDDGLYDVALATLGDAIDFGAAEEVVNFHRATVYHRMGDPREALALLANERVDPSFPTWEPHIMMQAELYYELSMYPSVSELLEPLLDRRADLSDAARTGALLLLAVSYTAAERPQDALRSLDRLEDELAPDDTELLELVAALRASR
ncbi:MAG: tetratricopeptide repeat protein [bacterium]